jgi:hypothetical protein
MVSIGPYTQSYVENPQSCFTEACFKNYRKGTVMHTLVQESPGFAKIAQIARLDDELDSPEFNGTCFAPSKTFFENSGFVNKLDPGSARSIVLASLLRAPVQSSYMSLFKSEKLPTRDRFSELYIEGIHGNVLINGNILIIKPDFICTNGILHITNGLIHPIVP